jgi:hypothetical protein
MAKRTRKPRDPELEGLLLIARLRKQSRTAVGPPTSVAGRERAKGSTATLSFAEAARKLGIDEPIRQQRRLLRSFFALPQGERDAFLRQIEVASLRWRVPARDPAPRSAARDDDAADDDVDDDDDWPAC